MNILAFPMRLTFNMNVKHCEGSIIDWIRGVDGKEGFHMFCYYDQGKEMTLLEPLTI